MKKLYTYRARTFSDQTVDTVIDLTKIVSIRQAGGGNSFHQVFCTGLRVPIELHDMPEIDAKSAEEYAAGRAANFNALVSAWEASSKE